MTFTSSSTVEDTLSKIEQHLSWVASEQGLLVLEQTGEAGWPRWLVLGASNAHGFISLEAPGEKLTSLQLHRVDSLARLGHLAICTDSKEGVDAFIKQLAPTRVSQWHGSAAELEHSRPISATSAS